MRVLAGVLYNNKGRPEQLDHLLIQTWNLVGKSCGGYLTSSRAAKVEVKNNESIEYDKRDKENSYKI